MAVALARRAAPGLAGRRTLDVALSLALHVAVAQALALADRLARPLVDRQDTAVVVALEHARELELAAKYEFFSFKSNQKAKKQTAVKSWKFPD